MAVAKKKPVPKKLPTNKKPKKKPFFGSKELTATKKKRKKLLADLVKELGI